MLKYPFNKVVDQSFHGGIRMMGHCCSDTEKEVPSAIGKQGSSYGVKLATDKLKRGDPF